MRHLAACLALSACVTFPEVEARVNDAALNAPYPDLVPIGPILAQGGQTTRDATISANRLAALRARASQLRGPVIDRATRLRMTQGVNQRGL